MKTAAVAKRLAAALKATQTTRRVVKRAVKKAA